MRRQRERYFSKYAFMMTVWTRMAEVRFPHPLNFRERTYWVQRLFDNYMKDSK